MKVQAINILDMEDNIMPSMPNISVSGKVNLNTRKTLVQTIFFHFQNLFLP